MANQSAVSDKCFVNVYCRTLLHLRQFVINRVTLCDKKKLSQFVINPSHFVTFVIIIFIINYYHYYHELSFLLLLLLLLSSLSSLLLLLLLSLK